LNQYEIAVLYHPDLEADLDKGTKKVEKLIADNGGKVTKVDNWGKKKLAYTIKKQDFAIYVFYTVEMPGEGVKKINDTLNITDEVVRFLIVKPDLKKAAKMEDLRAQKAKKAAERGEHASDDDDDKEEAEPRGRGRNRDEE